MLDVEIKKMYNYTDVEYAVQGTAEYILITWLLYTTINMVISNLLRHEMHLGVKCVFVVGYIAVIYKSFCTSPLYWMQHFGSCCVIVSLYYKTQKYIETLFY